MKLAARKITLGLVALTLAALTVPVQASASHSWGGYHWGTTAVPFTLGLDNNLTTTEWLTIGSASSTDWSASSVLDTPLSAVRTDNKRCKASSGRVEVCNGRFGNNGWLGLAQIWISGGHIVQGTAKMNDSYLASASYTTTNRRHVLCQEVGHTFGLDHQDESGADLNTCMDYADRLDNPSPNTHDYQQLQAIYNHTHATGTVATGTAPSGGKGNVKRLSDDLYVEDKGNGEKLFTFVTWVDDAHARAAPSDRAPE